MRRGTVRVGVVVPIVALILMGVVTRATLAQMSRRKRVEREDQSDSLYLRRLEGIGDEGLVKPPEYTFRNLSKTTARAREWGRVRLSYRTMPEWIDELQVDYYVLLKNNKREKEEKPPFTLLEGSVTYTDVKKGDDHLSEAFLHPNTIERYGEIVAVAVEVRYEGETVRLTENSKSKAPVKGKWWILLRDDPKVVSKDGYVLNRNHTPFVLANHNAYEPIRE
jgi:hypothetical protein